LDNRRADDLGVNNTRPLRRRAGWWWVISTAVVATLWILFFVANVKAWGEAKRPVGFGAMELELAFALLYVIRRQPLTVSRSRVAWLAAGGAVCGMLFARPAYDPVLGLGPIWATTQIVGAIAALVALLALGRSFGIVAANRGLKTSGPYRLVRHPVYAAYLLTMVGYLLENPSLRNIVLVSVVTGLQIVRIEEEERCLRADDEYGAYTKRVRYRLVPFVY
jgi:protein-S-isoprenylcysteine O-methyltransferase Ste14